MPANLPCTPEKQRLIAFLGPTASGKSALALRIAERFGGEIVSADSRLVYRYMDIGTAKPSAAERARIPHHVIDLVPPDAPYDLARWQVDAAAAIASIAARGRLPLLVGGTAQWSTALLDGWQPPAVAPDPVFRAAMEERVASEGVGPVWEELRARDPAAAETTGPNARRIIRALEVIRATGKPFSAQRTQVPTPYDDLRLGLLLPRDELYRRIDTRVESMLAAGLVDEVRALLEWGYGPELPAMSGIGYAQAVEYIRGDVTFNQMCERIKQATHRYARHQTTWLRRDPSIIWIDALDTNRANAESAVRIQAFLDAKPGP
jgi:tRNA dimethylallyltransferase